MKSSRSDVMVALTHFVKGAARFSFSARREAPIGPPDESRRRATLLQELYRVYSVEVGSEEGGSYYRDTLPPDAWINDQLEARSERWRVQNVDGFRCEIFDLHA